MFILIEFDFGWSFGIDIARYIVGFRLGIIAIHLVFTRFDEMVKAAAMAENEERKGGTNQ